MTAVGTYFGKMSGHALLTLPSLFGSPQGNSKLVCMSHIFASIFFTLPEIHKAALNLA